MFLFLQEGNTYEIEGIGNRKQYSSLAEVVETFMEGGLTVVKKDIQVSIKYVSQAHSCQCLHLFVICLTVI